MMKIKNRATVNSIGSQPNGAIVSLLDSIAIEMELLTYSTSFVLKEAGGFSCTIKCNSPIENYDNYSYPTVPLPPMYQLAKLLEATNKHSIFIYNIKSNPIKSMTRFCFESGVLIPYDETHGYTNEVLLNRIN